MRKLLTLAAIIAIINLPIGCGCDTGSCDDDGGVQETTINTIFISNAWINENFSTQDVNSDYTIAAISLEVTEVDYHEVAYKRNTFGSPFINSAYALRIAPAPEPRQLLTGVSITSNEDVTSGGQTYESGSDLSELFVVNSELGQLRGISINDFIDEQNSAPFLFGSIGSQVFLKLSDKPDLAINGNIVVELSFDDGTTFRSELTIFNAE